MSEERKKKSEAAWETEEDEELNESRAFVELTEYIANAVQNDNISLYLPNFISCIHYISHTLRSHWCQPSKLVWCHNLQLAVSKGLLQHAYSYFLLLFSNLDLQNVR